MIENPQIIGNNYTDQVIDEEYQDNVEQPIEQLVEQQVPQESDELTLRRSTRVKRSAIPSHYVLYLQESDYNIGAANDPETFSQAMSSKESNLWHNAMKNELDAMAFNQVWDLVQLPSDVKAIGCKWVFKTKKD